MGLLTQELPDPHWLLWCDSSLTGSPRIPALRTRLGRVRLGFMQFSPNPVSKFSLRFHQHTNLKEAAHTDKRFMCLEFFRSSSNADRLMGRSATFGHPIVRLRHL